MIGRALIIDPNPQRRSRLREQIGARHYQITEAESAGAAIANAPRERVDLILLRMGPGVEDFHQLAASPEFSNALVVPILERGFSANFRKEVLALPAGGFLNEEMPEDEWIAAIEALLRLRRALNGFSKAGETSDLTSSLRERAPELYQAVLARYEEAVKLALQRRIYKNSGDIFEPFRQIAKELFLAHATARDAVELHYQTLRKIAPTPDAPRAQAYLEVGRTTIIGLMGDLLTYYRDAGRKETLPARGSEHAAESRSESAIK